MLKLVLTRLFLTIPLIFTVVLLVFSLLHFSNVDPAGAILGENATTEQVAILRQEFGLDQPYLVQLSNWLMGLVQGDLGASFISGEAVWDSVMSRLPVTLFVMTGGMFVAVLLGVSLGVLGSIRPGGKLDQFVTVIVAVNLATPGFWLGILLATWLGVSLNLLPVSGYVPFSEDALGWARSLILPCAAAGLHASAVIARQTRSAMVGTSSKLYVTALRARGISYSKILFSYRLRDAAIPVITIIGMELSRVVGISLVVEQVFALPGIGTLVVDAVVAADRPVLLGTVLVVSAFIIMVFLVVDIILGVVNPKVRPQ